MSQGSQGTHLPRPGLVSALKSPPEHAKGVETQSGSDPLATSAPPGGAGGALFRSPYQLNVYCPPTV